MSKKLSNQFVLAIVGLLLSNYAATAQEEMIMAPKSVSRKEVAEFNEAIRLFNNKEVQPASDKLKLLSEAHPEFIGAQVMYGTALLQLGKLDDAIVVFHTVESADPEHSLMLFNLGTAYMLSGKRDRALEKFQKYVRLHPKAKYAGECQARIDALTTEVARTSGITNSKGQDNYLEEAMALGAMRWNKKQMPISVYIAPGQSKGYRDEFTDVLKKAFGTWADASQGKISFKFDSDPDNALIHCSWTDDPSNLANASEGGEALPMATLDGCLMISKIKFVTTKPLQPVIPIEYFRTVCLHEIGHALGLLGHSSQPGDVMLAALSNNADIPLSDRDKKTLYLLYTSPDSLIHDHPLKLINTSYHGSQTSPDNQAIKLTTEALQEMNKENYDKAISLLEEAKKLSPKLEAVYVNLAKAYNDMGNNALHKHDYVTTSKYFDLAIANLIQAKRKSMAIQYCDIMMQVATYNSNSTDFLKYKNLKRDLTGSN